jgi:hypothetical protein
MLASAKVLHNADLLGIIFDFLGLAGKCNGDDPIDDALALGATHRAARDVVRATWLHLKSGPKKRTDCFAIRVYGYDTTQWFNGNLSIGHPDRTDCTYLRKSQLFEQSVAILCVVVLGDPEIANLRRHTLAKYYLDTLTRELNCRRSQSIDVIREIVLSRHSVHARAFIYNNLVGLETGKHIKRFVPGSRACLHRLHRLGHTDELCPQRWKLGPCLVCGKVGCDAHPNDWVARLVVVICARALASAEDFPDYVRAGMTYLIEHGAEIDAGDPTIRGALAKVLRMTTDADIRAVAGGAGGGAR